MNDVTDLQILDFIRSNKNGVDIKEISVEFPLLFKEFDRLLNKLKILQTHKLIENIDSYWTITQEGDSYYRFSINQVSRKERDHVLAYEKLKNEATLARWMKKTYWWTFGTAILSLAFSLISLLNR